VSLLSSAPSRLSVPPTATVPAGQKSIPFNLTVIDNSISEGNQLVTVTASAPGFTNISATILIVDDEVPPVITMQPSSVSVAVSGTATFSVAANGTAPLSYFWLRNGNPITGATASSYSTNNVQLADSGAQFSCVVSNAYGTALSSNATMTVSSIGTWTPLV